MSALRLVTALLVMWWAPAAGAQASAPTWAEAVEAAWQRGATAAQAAALADRARAAGRAASAAWEAPPAVEVGRTLNRQRPAGSTRETEFAVSVPLWWPGERAARQAAASTDRDRAEAFAAAGRLRAAGAVREAGWEVLLQRAELAAAQAQADELDALARDVERRVAAGDLARADALAANAERLSGRSAQAQARQQLEAAERRWLELTGLPAVPLPPPLPAGGVPPAAPAGSEDAPPEHPALREARAEAAAARSRLDAVLASARDPAELVVRGRQETGGGEPTSNGVGLALRVPLGTADRNDVLRAAARAELATAEANEQALGRRLATEWAMARSAAASAHQQLADDTARAALLRERARLIDLSFKAGETPLPDLLRALAAAARAEAAVTRQQVLLGQAASRLEHAAGVLP